MTRPTHDDGNDPLADLRARARQAGRPAGVDHGRGRGPGRSGRCRTERGRRRAAVAGCDVAALRRPSAATALHAQRREVLGGTADLDRELADARRRARP